MEPSLHEIGTLDVKKRKQKCAIGRPACFNPNICICTQLLANHSIMDGLGFRISDNVTLLCHKDKQHSNRAVITKFLETSELMKRSLNRDPFGAMET